MINIFSLTLYSFFCPQENSMCRHISTVERDTTIGVIFIDDDDEIREKRRRRRKKRNTSIHIVKL